MNNRSGGPPIWAGIIIIMIFSIWPFKLLNGILCFGVVLGGMIPAYLYGKQRGNALESSEAILIGLKTGFWASVVIIALNTLGIILRISPPEPIGWLDPIPRYIYLVAVAFWDAFRNLAQGGGPSSKFDVTFIERSVVTLISNVVFSAFGGILASTMFKQEPPLEHSSEHR